MPRTKLDGAQQLRFSGSLDLQSQKIINLADATNANEAVTLAQLQASQAGIDPKDACRVATTANITLSGLQTIDGVSVLAGDRVLVKDQTLGQENGIYIAAAGAWTRSTDADEDAEVTQGLYTFAVEGTANATLGFILTTADPITVGTTPLNFTIFNSPGNIQAGQGLSRNGNNFDVNAGNGIEIVTDDVSVKVDGSTLKLTAAGVALADLPDGDILIGNGSNVATARTMSGDVTIDNLGVATVNGFDKTADKVFGEALTVTNNDADVDIAFAFKPGSLRVYLNGARQNEGASNDYTVLGTTITFADPLKNTPGNEDIVLVDYTKS